MICPYCRFPDSKVIDSRPKDDRIKRRRECIKCGARFTTYEIIEKPMLMVKKRSGSYEPFDRSKLIKGIFSAIKKRPVNIDDVEKIADNVENHYANELKNIAPSKEIGDLVMGQLRAIDPIAYIRFASVYKDFTDVESFVAIISELGTN
ncbi:MAG: transcriptional repressor NrdR [Ruminococcus sp.]|nr:transcriptional repressor NrdR [Ruminococcus sp.]